MLMLKKPSRDQHAFREIIIVRRGYGWGGEAFEHEHEHETTAVNRNMTLMLLPPRPSLLTTHSFITYHSLPQCLRKPHGVQQSGLLPGQVARNLRGVAAVPGEPGIGFVHRRAQPAAADSGRLCFRINASKPVNLHLQYQTYNIHHYSTVEYQQRLTDQEKTGRRRRRRWLRRINSSTSLQSLLPGPRALSP